VQTVDAELLVRAREVFVGDVDVAVVGERLDRKQVVRLVAAVVVELQGGRVDAEQQQPQGERAAPWRGRLGSAPLRPR